MKTRPILVAVASATLLFASGVIAQNTGSELEAGQRWLTLMNHDNDKTVSKQEFDDFMNQQFDAADNDHDGTLDARELGHLRAALVKK